MLGIALNVPVVKMEVLREYSPLKVAFRAKNPGKVIAATKSSDTNSSGNVLCLPGKHYSN